MLREDPNGKWGTNAPPWAGTWWGRRSADSGNGVNWGDYWLGSQNNRWGWKSRAIEAAPNATFVFDDLDCNDVELNRTTCELAVTTSRAWWSRSSYGAKQVSFLDGDGEWMEPQDFTAARWALGGWTRRQIFIVPESGFSDVKIMALPGTTQWGIYKATLRCELCEVTLLEDPNGIKGTALQRDAGWPTYWLGNAGETPRWWNAGTKVWNNYTDMPTELVMPYDDYQCDAPPDEPSLGVQDDGQMVCLLKARTARGRWAASWWGQKWVEFLVDEEWTAPQKFFKRDTYGWNHKLFPMLDSAPTAVRFSSEDRALAWQFSNVSLQCDTCEVVLRENPNGWWGTAHPWVESKGLKRVGYANSLTSWAGNWTDYWMGRSAIGWGTGWPGRKWQPPGSMESPANQTFPVDFEGGCPYVPPEPALGPNYCRLSMTTSKQRGSASRYGMKYVQFHVDGNWSEPMEYFRDSYYGGWTKRKSFVTTGVPDAVRVSVADDRFAASWGWYKASLNCGGCEVSGRERERMSRWRTLRLIKAHRLTETCDGVMCNR